MGEGEAEDVKTQSIWDYMKTCVYMCLEVCIQGSGCV